MTPNSGQRTVAITGSASGIGAASTSRLVARGHRVITVDRHDADVAVDLGLPEGRRAAIQQVGELCGGSLDGLVTCAGLAGAPSRAGSLLVSVNYFGSLALLEGLRPQLGAGNAPAAVAISSNSATIQPGVPAALVTSLLDGDEDRARKLADQAGSLATYPATKLAIAHSVRRLAPGPQWAGAGITLNAIAPGMIDTPLVAEGRADPEVAPLLDLLPLPVGRPGRAAEIAALIELLVGGEGGFFCGSVLLVDGGSEALLRGGDWPAAWRPGRDETTPWREAQSGPEKKGL